MFAALLFKSRQTRNGRLFLRLMDVMSVMLEC